VTHVTQPSRTVLVVEDEWIVRLIAAETLRDAGFEVVEAEDAQQALALVTSRRDIGVLFTDINMPGDLDGIALAWRVRQVKPDIGVILTSGKIRPAPGEAPEGAFLAKPYSPQDMTRTVSALLAA
jgi:CheY-like chemotaxis protein